MLGFEPEAHREGFINQPHCSVPCSPILFAHQHVKWSWSQSHFSLDMSFIRVTQQQQQQHTVIISPSGARWSMGQRSLPVRVGEEASVRGENNHENSEVSSGKSQTGKSWGWWALPVERSWGGELSGGLERPAVPRKSPSRCRLRPWWWHTVTLLSVTEGCVGTSGRQMT